MCSDIKMFPTLSVFITKNRSCNLAGTNEQMYPLDSQVTSLLFSRKIIVSNDNPLFSLVEAECMHAVAYDQINLVYMLGFHCHN